MECKTETAVIEIFQNSNTEAECPIDGDFLLPDYCPDIAAVLKCTVTPAVLSRRQSGDKLMVDGQSVLRVLYLDEDRKCMHTFECVQPFSCSVEGSEAGGLLPHISVRVNYLNCRAISPRRIDVHGALTVVCHSGKTEKVQALTDICGDGVHTRAETVCCAVPFGTAEKNFTVSEVADLGAGKPPAEKIIRFAVRSTVTAVKPMMDKIVLKGYIGLTTVYAVDGGEGATCQTQHEFPFSQIMEMEGVQESMQLAADIDAVTADVQVSPDQNGHNTLLAVSIKLCARVDVICNKQMRIVTDAYTSKHPATANTVRFGARESAFVRQDTSTLKEVLDLPSDNIADILDLWCEITSVTTRKENDCTYADGHLQICLAARDRDGVISYYEHMSDFTLQFDDACDDMDVKVRLCDTEYAVIGGKLEIRLEILSLLHGYKTAEYNALERFEPSAEPYPENKAALRICRVRKGSSLWEIAKSCHTAMEAIMEENNLEEDCVPEDCMLMVPLV